MNFNKTPFRAVIFDLDGTTANTMPDLSSSMNEMLRQFGFPERTYDELISYINRGAVYFVRHSLPQDEKIQSDGLLVAQCMDVYDKIYGQRLTENTYLYPGIPECIFTLKKAGIKLALLSNKQHPRVVQLANYLFSDMPFDIVLGQGQYPPKPDKSALQAILKDFGLSPGESVMVGDSDIDIITAKNALLHSVGVTWGYRSETLLLGTGADFIAHSPPELTRIILGKAF